MGGGIGEQARYPLAGTFLQHPLDQRATHQPAHGVGDQMHLLGPGFPAHELQQPPQVLTQGLYIVPVAVADTFRGAVVVAIYPEGAQGETLRPVAFLLTVQEPDIPVLVHAGEDVGIAVIFHQAHQRTLEDKEVGIAIRSGTHLGAAEVEAVVGQVHRVLDGALAARVAPDVDDWQVPAHVTSLSVVPPGETANPGAPGLSIDQLI